MPLFFQVLASGSKGNAILVGSPKTNILVDAGLTGKELSRRLAKSPIGTKEIDAIIISHEHQDHVRGAGVLSRRFELPVYLSRGTLENLSPSVGSLGGVKIFQSGNPFLIGDLEIHAFATSHDAREPAGFTITHEGYKLGICTDLGVVTQLVRTRLEGCHGLVLEANHDYELLIQGPYPWELKQRIRSRHGHLSNAESLELLRTLHHENLQSVVLAHLSEVNNSPGLVTRMFQELHRLDEWQKVRFALGDQYEAIEGIELL